MTPTISWSRDKLAALKVAYDKAVAERASSFTFVEMDGTSRFARKVGEHPFVTSYAKYLIEYLEGEFGRNPDQPRRPNLEGKEGQ